MAATAFLGERSRTELAALARAPNATESFAVPSAVDSLPLGMLPAGTPVDLAEAAARARDAQRSWAAMPAAFRRPPLRRLSRLLVAYQNLVADVIRAESGALPGDALVRAGNLATECSAVTRSATGKLRPVRHREAFRLRAVTVREPFGLVGIVPNPEAGCNPAPVAAALLAGNAVLLVPEGAGCFGALVLAQLFAAARLPRDLVQVVPGTAGLADAAVPLVDHLLVGRAGGRSRRLRQLSARHGISVATGWPSEVAGFTAPRTVVRG